MSKHRLNASPWAACATLVVTALGIAGCKVGPDYEAAPYTHDAQFVNQDLPGLSGEDIETAWWKTFNDPILNDLIARAAVYNHDIRVAEANLRAARELLFQARRDFFPVVTSGASYTFTEISGRTDAYKDAQGQGPSALQKGVQIAQTARGLANAQTAADKALAAASAVANAGGGSSSPDRSSDLFQGGFDATWEANIFGHVSRSVEAQRAELERVQALERDLLVSVFAEVAQNYFLLRGTQNQLDVAKENAKNQQATYDLTVALLDGGRGTDLDTARAKAQLSSTRATVPPLEASVEKAIYRLGVLVGEQPSALTELLRAPQPMPTLPEMVAIGSPESLFRRRPDIRASERALARSVALVGVETADLFPKVTFRGSIGVGAGDFADLFNASAITASVGPSLHWAAFDLGRVRSRIRAADARSEAALAQYESVVLHALEETEQALITYEKEKERRGFLDEATVASRKAVDLATQRYQFGVDDFLTVLDAERRLLESESLFASSETNTALSLIAVYKALGGSWLEGDSTPALPVQ